MGTNTRLEVFVEDEIYGKAEILAHLLLQRDESEEVEAIGLLCLDQYIDVAFGTGVASGPASEHLKGNNAMGTG